MVSASGGVAARFERGFRQLRHGAQQPRRAEGAQRIAHRSLAREMHRRRAAFHGELGAVAAVDGEPHLVQIGDMADGRRQDRRRGGAPGARLGEFGFGLAGAAGKRRIEHAVKRHLGRVRHHRHDVGELDALLAVGIKDELADLVARGEPVAAEQRDQRRARVGRDRQFGLAHLVVDQPGDGRVVIGVAGQRGGDFGLLAQRAQWRALFQVAGLDDDAAFVRGLRQHRLERGGDVARTGPHQHGAAAAEQRHGQRLLDQPRRIGGELLAFDAGERERIVGIVDRSAHQRIDALAHQPGVRSVDQHDRLARIGASDEAIDIGGFDGGHVPATKYEARRDLILSAITLAARSSASRKPRVPAKRCCWPGMS